MAGRDNDFWVKVPIKTIRECGYTSKLLAYIKIMETMNHKTGALGIPERAIASDFGLSKTVVHRLAIRARTDRGFGVTKTGPKADHESEEIQGLSGDDRTASGPRPDHTTKIIDNRRTTTTNAPEGRESHSGAVVTKPKTPKPPTDTSPPCVWLSWNFYEFRSKKLSDLLFDPYDGKNIKICDRIIKEKSGGDLEEAQRRARNLINWFFKDPNFYHPVPGTLWSHWDRLHLPPTQKTGAELKSSAVEAERQRIQDGYKNQ